MGFDRRADAHYLHAPRPIEPVIAAPIEAPRALSWRGDSDELLVGAADGTVWSVETAYGTRKLFTGPAEPVHLCSRGPELAIVGAGGQLAYLRNGAACWTVDTGLVASLGLRLGRDGVAAIGDDARGRREVVCFDGDGRELVRVPVPAGVALGTDGQGEYLVARATLAGLSVRHIEESLPGGEATSHRLRFARAGRVVGVATGGATLWIDPSLPPRNVRLMDTVSAAVHRDGHTLALGTKHGGVAIVDADGDPAARSRPARVDMHGPPVRAMSFAARGRWLATVAEACRVWAF
ncbi:MAG: hypothetical protein FJ102_15790 [Deltaproteobacteria bacterium]|nr:hypothetical protein [Deltaproteobacteria bacterium]